jgi:hypothetical protein
LRLQRLGRGLILRHGFGVDVVEPLYQVRVAQRFLQRFGQLLDDLVGRALGRIDSVPGADFKTLQTRFVCGRQIRHRPEPGLRRDGVALDQL